MDIDYEDSVEIIEEVVNNVDVIEGTANNVEEIEKTTNNIEIVEKTTNDVEIIEETSTNLEQPVSIIFLFGKLIMLKNIFLHRYICSLASTSSNSGKQ